MHGFRQPVHKCDALPCLGLRYVRYAHVCGSAMQEQVRLVQSLGMSYEILRHDSAKFDARLRVLPRA